MNAFDAEAFVKHRSSVQARLAAPHNTRYPVDPWPRPGARSAPSGVEKRVGCTDLVHGPVLCDSRTDRRVCVWTSAKARVS